MGNPRRHTVSVTTATGGGATGFTPVVHGMISLIKYTKDDFASTADFTITTEDSGQNLWTEVNVNASQEIYPATEADLPSGTESVLTEVPLYAAHERIKFVIAQGGNTKAGAFAVIIV